MGIGSINLIGFNTLEQFNGFNINIDDYSEFDLSELTTNRTAGTDYKSVTVYPTYIHDIPEVEQDVSVRPGGRIPRTATYKQLDIRLKSEKIPDSYNLIREVSSLATWKYLAIEHNDYFETGYINDTNKAIFGYANFNIQTLIAGYRYIEITFHSRTEVAGFG